MKDVHNIIVRPHITERSVAASYGDPRIKEEANIVHKYTFVVANDANKIEIKRAIEQIYNAGKKKKDELIVVEKVRTIRILGKRKRRIGTKVGYQPNQKKAIVTLKAGQVLEDYGV